MKKKKRAISLMFTGLIIMTVCLVKWNYIVKPSESLDFSASEIEHEYNYHYEISSIDEWHEFVNSVNSGKSFLGYKVSLTRDLEFDNISFPPIGNYYQPFRGEFDGMGHRISGYSVVASDGDDVGIFGYTVDVYIHDIDVENVNIDTGKGFLTGGLVGVLRNGYLKNCFVSATVHSDSGSVGGIVGANHGIIEKCTIEGTVDGGSEGSYGDGEYGSGGNCGNGGIAGNNEGIINLCKNFSNVGITGWNNGTVADCFSDSSNNTGGGIVEHNHNGLVYRCFNFGNALAGIATSCNVDGRIEQCVNLGSVDGRYKADIVSFLGQEGADKSFSGHVTNCLFTNSSKNGIARHEYTKCAFNNYKIHRINDSRKKVVRKLLEKNDFQGAYNYLITSEKTYRHVISGFLLLFLVAIVLFVFAISIGNKKRMETKLYKNALKLANGGHEYEAMGAFSRLDDYKDSKQLAKQYFEKHLHQCRECSEYKIGVQNETPIIWDVLAESESAVLLISRYGLFTKPIDEENSSIDWKKSSLYWYLNTTCKNEWFNETEREYLLGELSMLDEEQAKRFFNANVTRKCKPNNECKNAIMSVGFGYWWIIEKSLKKSDRFPFVTADGMINLHGKRIGDQGIMVRPIIYILRGDIKNA